MSEGPGAAYYMCFLFILFLHLKSGKKRAIYVRKHSFWSVKWKKENTRWKKATREICKREAWVGRMQNSLLHPASIFLSVSCVLE